MVLKVRDHVPSERTIRRALATVLHGPPDALHFDHWGDGGAYVI